MHTPTHGDYTSKFLLKKDSVQHQDAYTDFWGVTLPNFFSKTRHDAMMFVPTLGEYHFKKMIWFGTQSDHTKSWGLQVDLSCESSKDASTFESTQGATDTRGL